MERNALPDGLIHDVKERINKLCIRDESVTASNKVLAKNVEYHKTRHILSYVNKINGYSTIGGDFSNKPEPTPDELCSQSSEKQKESPKVSESGNNENVASHKGDIKPDDVNQPTTDPKEKENKPDEKAKDSPIKPEPADKQQTD